MARLDRRDGITDGLVGALFPGRVALPRPPETEIVELLDAADVEAWALEHEVTHDGHECDDLLLRYRDEIKVAVHCPDCQVLVSAPDVSAPEGAATAGAPPEPTHGETAALVLRANLGTAALLALVTWLASLGFTTPGMGALVAVTALAGYAALTRER